MGDIPQLWNEYLEENKERSDKIWRLVEIFAKTLVVHEAPVEFEPSERALEMLPWPNRNVCARLLKNSLSWTDTIIRETDPEIVRSPKFEKFVRYCWTFTHYTQHLFELFRDEPAPLPEVLRDEEMSLYNRYKREVPGENDCIRINSHLDIADSIECDRNTIGSLHVGGQVYEFNVIEGVTRLPIVILAGPSTFVEILIRFREPVRVSIIGGIIQKAVRMLFVMSNWCVQQPITGVMNRSFSRIFYTDGVIQARTVERGPSSIQIQLWT